MKVGPAMPTETIPVAMLHFAPVHKETEGNRRTLLAAVQEAAQAGASMVIAPELCLSGYSFVDTEDASPFAESEDGPTLQALSALCVRHKIYVVLGLLERDKHTGLLHNSAFALSPEGAIVCRYRKLTTVERRWATPGQATQESCFDTPWGKVGLLICADSYFALPARTLALKGADLLLVLANWPPGGVDPRILWRTRALENGVTLLACNRTGLDQRMDCREARSYAVDHFGNVLLDAAYPESRIFPVNLPLKGAHGRLIHSRSEILSHRQPWRWRALGLDVNGETAQHWLWGEAPTTPLSLLALNSHSRMENLESWLQEANSACIRVLLLADDGMSRIALEWQRPWPHDLFLAGSLEGKAFFKTWERLIFQEDASPLLDYFHGYRLAVSRPESLLHPEETVQLAKRGCDLLCIPPSPCVKGRQNPPTDGNLCADAWRDLIASRCLERLPLALAGEGTVCLPPEAHGPWVEEAILDAPFILDMKPFRMRQIFDRLDIETLLQSMERVRERRP